MMYTLHLTPSQMARLGYALTAAIVAEPVVTEKVELYKLRDDLVNTIAKRACEATGTASCYFTDCF